MLENKYPYSILFVEDEIAIRQNYVKYFQLSFENVYEAKDGEEGYEVYKKKKPDIMIVDINIPKLNGIDLVKMIRKTDHATKVIILTAHTDTNFLLEAATLKLTKYLVKPINRKTLQNSIDLVLEELSNFKVVSIKKIDLSNNYSWDNDSKELNLFNDTVILTKKEQLFLTLLFSNYNKTFTYDEIFDFVWKDDKVGTVDALKSLIKGLRKKIPQEIIKNIFGIGYKIKT